MWLAVTSSARHGNAVTSSILLADPPSNETIDVFYIKKLAFFRITAHLVANETEARQITRDKRLRECWKCPFQRGVGCSFSYACFGIYTYLNLGLVVCGTLCIYCKEHKNSYMFGLLTKPSSLLYALLKSLVQPDDG